MGTEKQPDVAKANEVASHKSKCKAPMSCLIFNISSELKDLIAECDIPREAWQILNLNLVLDGRCQHLVVFNSFLECNMGSGDTIRSYTNRLSGYLDELSKIGKPLDELFVCYQLLRKMPEKFHFVIQCLL